MTVTKTRETINNGGFDDAFARLYPFVPIFDVRDRYNEATAEFGKKFGTERDIIVVSAPGRTEIGGNHTDHQRGCVLAAAVNLDVICVASKNDKGLIQITSRGYPPDAVDLDMLEPVAEEHGKSASLVRGIAAWLSGNGYNIGGMDVYMTSDVLVGSGLSSSAAYEVAIGSIQNYLYNENNIAPTIIAIASQYAENTYFGKPSGLMDQIASAVGGLIHIDFKTPGEPAVKPVAFDFAAFDYSLCIVDTKASHVDLTSAYAAIPAEMRAVASVFGKDCLGEVDEAEFFLEIKKARIGAGDRAVLRAIHFFSDNRRVGQQAAALGAGEIDTFLRLVIESGESSLACLQNIFYSPEEQGLSIALALSKRILKDRGGAWRVHGGGFAGTIQAFVPNKLMPEYRSAIGNVFGDNSCHRLSVRPVGGTVLLPN